MLEIDKDNNIKLTRGDTAYIDITSFVDGEGDPYFLHEGDKIYFRLKTEKYILTKQLALDLAENTATLILNPQDTLGLSFATHRYEMELVTYQEEHFTFFADKNFTIGRELEVHNG